MRFIVILMLLISTTGFAQKKKKGKEAAQPAATEQQAPPPTQPQTQPQQQAAPVDSVSNNASIILTEHYLKKYATATRWNDAEVAKSALYDVIVENPGMDSIIYSLAFYYYEDEKYASSLLISQDLLGRDPKNTMYLEMAATSAQQLGVPERALQNYESLYLINDNIRTMYQIAFLQYQLKRYAECKTSIDILLGRADMDKEKAVFEDAKGNSKEYPLKVPVLNLRGLLARDQGDKAGAKKSFNEALAISPDFVMAKTNLTELDKTK